MNLSDRSFAPKMSVLQQTSTQRIRKAIGRNPVLYRFSAQSPPDSRVCPHHVRGTGSTQVCHSGVISHLFTKVDGWRLPLDERSTEEVTENIRTMNISTKQALFFFCSSLTNDTHLLLPRLKTNLD